MLLRNDLKRFLDVSMAAIQYLNNYYMGRQLEHESEFVSQCMANLTQATQDLATNEEAGLLCIQRALLLLNTHLDTFKRRCAMNSCLNIVCKNLKFTTSFNFDPFENKSTITVLNMYYSVAV